MFSYTYYILQNECDFSQRIRPDSRSVFELGKYRENDILVHEDISSIFDTSPPLPSSLYASVADRVLDLSESQGTRRRRF